MTEELWQKHHLLKTIAILCVIVMVFCFAPMNVFAQTVRENLLKEEEVEQLPILANQEEQQEIYKTKKIITEDIEKRTRNEKHYILEDGTKVATIYPSNVHYQEEEKFIEIDNTLEEKKDEKETLKLTKEELQQETILQEKEIEQMQQESMQINKEQKIKTTEIIKELETNMSEQIRETKIYENKSNSYKTKFTNKTKEYYLGSITSQNKTITWRLRNANSAKIQVKNPEENNKIETGTTVENLQINQLVSTIEYNNILPNTNIQYTVLPEEIKEAIVLENQGTTVNKFVFDYETDGLIMKLLDNKDIIFYEEKEENVQFTMKAPFMYDNKLEFSDQIDVELKQNGEKYELTLIPNKEWLLSADRVYPVIIDPTIQTSLYVQDIDDTFIYQGDTNNTTRYQAHILRVGNGAGSGNSMRSLIKFNLPTLNSGDQVIAAELSLSNYPDSSEWNPPTDERIISAHKITSNWSASSANWSNMSNKYDGQVIDYIKYKYDNNNPLKDNRFNITALVKDWYITGNNYGVMLKEHEEKAIYTGSDAYFFSADTSGTYTNYRPKIIIAYRNQTGLENYLSYHIQSAGRAGEIYTNDYNGNLTLVHQDAATPGNRLPVTVEHIYNTNEKDIDIGYGKGMRLNLAQTLETTKIGTETYMKYIDEDATAHYFTQNANSIYEDEDGLGLTAKLSDSNMIMEDKSGNIMTFTKYSNKEKWHLKEVKDTNGNKITLTLTTSRC